VAQALCIAIAGAIGTLCRWGIGRLAVRLFGPSFPYGTLIVNILGCFLIGLVMHLSLASVRFSPVLKLTLTVGFLGALTTFSAFSYETIVLIEKSGWTAAVMNISMNLLFGMLATLCGLVLGRTLFGEILS